MKNLKIEFKIAIIFIIALIMTIFIAFAGIHGMNSIGNCADNSAYDESIYQQVSQALLLLDYYNGLYKEGILTLEEAKKQGADMLRKRRYGESGYFWADDAEGNNIVLLGSKTEGTNRIDTVDSNGFHMVRELIAVGQKEGGGYVDYMFPKEGETEPKQKRGYTRYYEPFGWIVGTGNYLEDMNEFLTDAQIEVRNIKQHYVKIMILFAVVFSIIIIFLFVYITKDINFSLKEILRLLKLVEEGNLTVKVDKKYLDRKDEFGQLLTAVKHLVEALHVVVADVKSQSAELLGGVAEVHNNMYALNEEIVQISETTQSISASMQQTAASAQEIDAMTHEMEDVSNDIANRSREGALKAQEIQERAVKAKEQTQLKAHQMEVIRDEIRDNLKNALEEAKVVKQIEKMADIINEITEQTTLLAINASIEAARAGEHGKGFAVVASEVQYLAEESNNTVGNIYSIIKKVNNAINNLSNDASRLLDFVSLNVTDSFKDFLNIADEYSVDAAYIDELVAKFEQTSKTMNNSVKEVSRAISEISEGTNDSAGEIINIAGKNNNITEKSNQVLSITDEAGKAIKSLEVLVEQFIV